MTTSPQTAGPAGCQAALKVSCHPKCSVERSQPAGLDDLHGTLGHGNLKRKAASTVTAPESMAAARTWSQLAGRARRQQLAGVPHFERGDLDWYPARDRGEPGPPQGRVQAGDVDDPEPAEVFLGLRVRPVGNQEVITGLAHHGRRLRREQAAVE